jgi:hypothetical protein
MALMGWNGSVSVHTCDVAKSADGAAAAAQNAVVSISSLPAFEAAAEEVAAAVVYGEWLMERMIRQREPLLEDGWRRY